MRTLLDFMTCDQQNFRKPSLCDHAIKPGMMEYNEMYNQPTQ